MAIRVIDDSKLQNIAVAIQGKDGGGTMAIEEQILTLYGGNNG